MMASRVDLHLHTTLSDGTDSPQRVVELAKQAGLSALAITDHDTTQALPIAEPLARREGLELIPGIEMSASAGGAEVHLLGLFIDPAHGPFRRHLEQQQARRERRVHEMVRQLARVGVAISAEEVLRLSGEGTAGRPHVARVLVSRGYVSSIPEAFERYIGEGKPGFVPGSPIDPSGIIRLILDAGGVPVLAHPVFLKNDPLIDRFARDGLAGLEVYHSSHTPEAVERYEGIARRLHLLMTGGSDYHGDSKEGVSIGAMKVPYGLVEELKRWQATSKR